jgi:hypothetical protein
MGTQKDAQISSKCCPSPGVPASSWQHVPSRESPIQQTRYLINEFPTKAFSPNGLAWIREHEIDVVAPRRTVGGTRHSPYAQVIVADGAFPWPIESIKRYPDPS